MRNHRPGTGWIVMIVGGLGASMFGAEPSANDPDSAVRAILQPYTNYARIMDGNPIYLPSTGRIDVAFDLAREIAPDVELVARLAEAAVDSSLRLRRVPGGTNTYFFTNVNREDCDLLVLQNSVTADRFCSTTVAEGERFFGRFVAIIYVESDRAADGKTTFAVHLYGYPENPFWRFVTRNFRAVREYFRSRVMAVIGITTRTYEALQNDPRRMVEAMERNRHPTNDLGFTQEEVDRVRSLVVRFAGYVPAATNAPSSP